MQQESKRKTAVVAGGVIVAIVIILILVMAGAGGSRKQSARSVLGKPEAKIAPGVGKQQTLAAFDSGKAVELLDLDTGRTMTVPSAKIGPESVRWVRDQQMDVLGANSARGRGLFCYEMAFVKMEGNTWDAVSLAQVRSYAKRLLEQRPRTMALTAEADENPHPIYLFRTGEDGVGVLQIIGFFEEPKGVHIRYRMLGRIGDLENH